MDKSFTYSAVAAAVAAAAAAFAACCCCSLLLLLLLLLVVVVVLVVLLPWLLRGTGPTWGASFGTWGGRPMRWRPTSGGSS
jgi:hypothetical protein